MGYSKKHGYGKSSGGFYNKRSKTWVSHSHARQGRGEVVNGYVKCYNPKTGHYYMKRVY